MLRTAASALRLASAIVLSACAGTTEKAKSVERVDDLLERVERVEADTAASKESARAAFDHLASLCSPSFGGDAKKAYVELLERIDASEDQARQLRADIEPMCASADALFRRWTLDLESFDNARMRQRSQTRLDETQARFRSLSATAHSALISYDAFHENMHDHALFLSHDMNASAVAELEGDVRQLREVLGELDGRMDACAAAARAYVDASALYSGAVAPAGESRR